MTLSWRDCRVVEDTAERAGNENVSLLRVDFIGSNGNNSVIGFCGFDRGFIDVRGDHFRSGFVQAAAQVHAGLAEPLQGKREAGKVIAAKDMPHGCLDRNIAAKRREHRRIEAAGAFIHEREGIIAITGHMCDVVNAHPDVDGRPVPPVKGLHVLCERRQQSRLVRRPRVPR